MDTGAFSLGLFAGMVAGIAIMSIGFYWMLQRAKAHKPVSPKVMTRGVLVAVLFAMSGLALMFGQSQLILAQSDTPVPLVIPINTIFVQANNWMQTLSPIMSLSIGIIIAVAVFGFLAKAIKSAF